MDYAYYPGCSLESTARPYDVSLRRVFERLGVGLREIEDWNCCGATSYITINKLTAYSISARNLAYAEKMGLDVCAPCSSCYTILSKVNRHMQWGEEHTRNINDVLAAAGLSYSAKVDVLHPLDILVNKVGVEKIAAKAVRRLDGIRIAPYYGCQIVRPRGRFDDREEPTALDELFAALGGTVVPFGSKLRCCGGMLMTTLEEVALKLNRDILAEAAAAGSRRGPHDVSAVPDEPRGLPGTDRAGVPGEVRHPHPVLHAAARSGPRLHTARRCSWTR